MKSIKLNALSYMGIRVLNIIFPAKLMFFFDYTLYF